jgi:hypothetical protein
VLIMRREGTQLQGILQRMQTLLGNRDGFNGQANLARRRAAQDVLIEFGSCPNLGDEQRQQGRPHDLLVFDEAANFLEEQVRFLLGWNRSTREGVHSQALLTFNPPTSAEGRWIVDFFGPWLDKKHPLYPTPPGVIRYCVMLPGENGTSATSGSTDRRRAWSWAASWSTTSTRGLRGRGHHHAAVAHVHPLAHQRQPVPGGSGYLRQLQAMPEPLRSQMLYGDFQAGMQDDPWQVIPTAWVEAAHGALEDRAPKGEMMGQGVDVARGGKDNTTSPTATRTPTAARATGSTSSRSTPAPRRRTGRWSRAW